MVRRLPSFLLPPPPPPLFLLGQGRLVTQVIDVGGNKFWIVVFGTAAILDQASYDVSPLFPLPLV